MNDMTQATKEKLIADVKMVLADTEELVKLTAGEAGERLGEVRTRLAERLDGARGKLAELEGSVVERTRAAARVTDEYVHEHPWKAVGTAAGLGLIIGLLIGRR